MKNQNDMEHYADMVTRGVMTAEQANVEMVRGERVRVVSKLPKDVRNALNSAVKNGLLCHKKKSGKKPEVYYHPDFEYLANAERNLAERKAIEALKSVMAYKEV